MPSDLQEPGQSPSDLFRPAKRRRFYRKRIDTEDDKASDGPSPQPTAISQLQTVDELISQNGNGQSLDAHEEEDNQPSIADLIRQRKAIQRRRGGIEFTNLNPSLLSSDTATPIGAVVLREDETAADMKSVIERFTPQTGQVTETTDKHMYVLPSTHPLLQSAATNVVRMAYIDSELAKRTRQNQATFDLSHNGYELSQNGALLDTKIQRQPAALGKLHEIDLGPDATLRNIARTEAAQRKLDGIEPETDEKTGKVRLRKDGKPYGWRKRRNSNDVKRDNLVEEVMRESRLEIYDELDDEGPNDDQAADDRIAEQFRREFLDAVSTRKQKAVQDKKPVRGQPVDDQPKGPKLGGSRSARAAMREKQEAAAKKR